MCFFNSLSVNATTLESRFNASFPKKSTYNPVKKGNAFSAISWPVITGENEALLIRQEWGLIPSWVKDNETAKKLRFQTLNARSETVFEKPSFRNSIRNKRCLIPSTGFYEWQHEGKKKIPWFIKMKKQEIFSMAGIWDEWINNETGEIFRGFSILTTAANSIMEKIHNTKKRMPVILSPGNEHAWLNAHGEKNNLSPFFVPVKDETIETIMLL
jgi:putative SOS response-associated peptidase YedK